MWLAVFGDTGVMVLAVLVPQSFESQVNQVKRSQATRLKEAPARALPTKGYFGKRLFLHCQLQIAEPSYEVYELRFADCGPCFPFHEEHRLATLNLLEGNQQDDRLL